MLKDFAKYLPITTISLIYMYLCGSLYLIGFWSTFDIDISNFVSISEIPKSFIYPFVVTQAIFLVYNLSDVLVPFSNKEGVDIEFKHKWLEYALLNDVHLIIASTLCIVLFPIFGSSIYYWWLLPNYMGLTVVVKALRQPYLKELIPSLAIRRYVTLLVIYTPFACVQLGKIKSLGIYKNNDIKYIKADITNNNKQIFAITDSTRLKLLGFLGDKIIASSLDNKKTYILNQAFLAIELDDPIKDTVKAPVKKVQVAPDTLHLKGKTDSTKH